MLDHWWHSVSLPQSGAFWKPLLGGNVNTGIVRVGDAVRRVMSGVSPAVHGLLRHLEACGFNGCPRFLGLEGQAHAGHAGCQAMIAAGHLDRWRCARQAFRQCRPGLEQNLGRVLAS